jgi:potassium efflux system protein
MPSASSLKRVFHLFAIVALWVVSAHAIAADTPDNELKAMVDQVKRIERNIKRDRYDVKQLTEANKAMAEFKTRVATCISSNEEALAKVNAALEQLGEKKTGESVEVAKQRRQHESERAAIETRMADCNALALHLAKVQEAADGALKKRLEARMSARGPNIFTVIRRNLEQPVQWFGMSGRYVKEHSWLLNQATVTDILWMVSTLLLGLGLGLWLRRQGLPAVRRRHWSDTTSGRFGAAALASCCYSAPYVLASLSTAICLGALTHGIHPIPFFSALAYGLSLFFIANMVIRIGLDPVPPGQLFLDVPPAVARPMARRFQVLMVLLLVVSPLINNVVVLSLPDFAQSLAHTIVRILLAINIVWVLWLFRFLRGVTHQAWFRYLLSLVLIVAVIADLSGYSNLSGWMFRSVFGSLVALGLVMTVARLLRDFLIGVEYGATPWGRKARRFLGLPATEEHLGGLFWVRMLVTLGLWALLAWLFVLIWDLSTSAVQDINRIVTEGFQVGSLKIVPSRVLLAVVTLALLIAVNSWLKGRIKHQLEKSPMERGSREALVTVAGYSGVLIAILAALGVAGIEFANLALIAGALSVGIGFGLQNIVNNFVSGLILLIERPVKTGDWIVVGGTEGYVKRIRIRSTQIQTFDRADVIVPNSELISSQVTNWMLRDTTGRVRIPVGVAYGTETQKVKEILLQAASEHPDVITRNPAMAPLVLFIGFGDSSLDFELRVYIGNIDHRLRVKSDLNFAIDAAFREAGVEIPFPQRDLHIKHWPGRGVNSDDDQGQ